MIVSLSCRLVPAVGRPERRQLVGVDLDGTSVLVTAGRDRVGRGAAERGVLHLAHQSSSVIQSGVASVPLVKPPTRRTVPSPSPTFPYPCLHERDKDR